MKRPVYLLFGILFVALGAIGAALPIVPTVPFLIVAAFCFARSSPALERKLLEHPVYGRSLRDWRERGAIGHKAKLLAIGGMTAGVLFTAFTIGFPWAFISIAILVTVGPWIWSRPE